jgi:peptidoglycan hydrolase-like protein with peptidoglycan-binding domain
MAIYRVGSPKSDEVKQIQQKLGITADGVYGQQTKDAVTAYQKANNLQVDGVVGDETWNSLFGTNTVTQTPQTTQNTVTQYTAPQITPANRQDYAYDPNTNEAYLNALKALEQANKNAPTYGASYDQQLQELYDKIVNREDFTYDLNADALYEQYQQKFTALGDQAMQDTMGQAAALTGGYASSYAQNAGQQAYNQYLTQLNDIVPDLYNQAYGRYQDEGQDLLNQYGMLGDMADDEYAKYMDAYNQWLAQLQMSREDVDTAYNRGYTDFVNSQQMAYQQDQANIAYAQWQQEMAAQQQRWEQEMAYQRERDAVADSQWAQELAAKKTSPGGDGDTGGGTSEYSWAVKEAKRNGGNTEEGQLRYLEQMQKRGQITEKELIKFAKELVGS